MNMTDAEFFEGRPDLTYRLREWSEGDPLLPFITREAAPELFEGYVLTTVVRRDGEASVVWADPMLHNRGVIRTEQIIDVVTTRPEKWSWANGLGMLRPTLIPL
jgi:hypothetical protein